MRKIAIFHIMLLTLVFIACVIANIALAANHIDLIQNYGIAETERFESVLRIGTIAAMITCITGVIFTIRDLKKRRLLFAKERLNRSSNQ